MKKMLLGVLSLFILVIGIFSINFYKDYQDYQSIKRLVYKEYIPALKRNAEYLDKYSSFNNPLELSEWQVNEGFDINLELRREFEDAQLKIALEEVSSTEAKKLKKLIIEGDNVTQLVLKKTYESEDIDDIEDLIGLLRFQVQEMNTILKNNW